MFSPCLIEYNHIKWGIILMITSRTSILIHISNIISSNLIVLISTMLKLTPPSFHYPDFFNFYLSSLPNLISKVSQYTHSLTYALSFFVPLWHGQIYLAYYTQYMNSWTPVTECGWRETYDLFMIPPIIEDY